MSDVILTGASGLHSVDAALDAEGGARLLRNIAESLILKDRIAVLVHNSTDGDTLGSAVAVSLALKKLCKHVTLVHEEGFISHLLPILGDQSFFLRVEKENRANVAESGAERGAGSPLSTDGLRWDAVVTLDVADPKLLGKREKLLGQAELVINIDHHVTNSLYGDFNLIHSTEAATAVIAYDLISELGVPMDKDMSLAIYTGICTDTGGFSYANTTAKSHIIAAECLEYGIDVAYLRYIFFDAVSQAKLKCQAYVASTLTFLDGGTVALAVLSAETLRSLGAKESDCDGLVNIGSNVIGVNMSLLAREIRNGVFRVNLRSRGARDVSKIAGIWGGGGHKNASGCTINASHTDIVGVLTAAIF